MKKFFAIILSVLMVLSTVVITASAKSNTGSVSDAYAWGEGKTTVTYKGKSYTVENDTITVDGTVWNLVDSKEDLEKIKAATGNFLMMSDVDLGVNVTDFSTGSAYYILTDAQFKGVLDGNGYAIKGVSVDMTHTATGTTTAYVGLMRFTSGTVKNLTFGTKDAPIKIHVEGSNGNFAMGLLNTVITSSNETIRVENVKAYCDLQYTSTGSGAAFYLGGLIARAYSGTSNYVLKDIEVEGKINVSSNAASSKFLAIGGIVGGVNSTATSFEMINCNNRAEITRTGSGNSYSGGIIGYTNVAADMIDSVNHGAITSTNRVGGIVGHAAKPVYMEGCLNTGKVASTGQTAGGMTAYANGASRIISCANVGAVSSTKGNAAGLVAYANNASFELTNCYGTDTVTASGSYIAAALVASNCATHEKVTDNYYVGTATYGVYTANADGPVGEVAGAAEKIDAADLASGKLAYLLGKTYGQKLGSDAYPIPASTDYVAVDYTAEPNAYINTKNVLSVNDGKVDGYYAAVQFATVEGSNKMRLVIVSDETTLAALTSLKLSFAYGANTKDVTLNADDLSLYLSVDAAGELFYAECGSILTGIVIKNVPAEVFVNGTVSVSVVTADGETALGSAACTLA